MDQTVLVVFGVVYLGMILGEIPGLRLDRSGIALLGAIALLALGKVGPAEAWTAIDVPTMALLLGLMIVSAQFRLGGFYTWVTRRLAAATVSPAALLGLLMLAGGGLSAVLANDIVCLAMTPVLVDACTRRRLDPLPMLLGLACASNIGSAATLIGNPQNILIGARLKLSFAGYLADALPPAALGLLAAWGIIAWQFRGRWETHAPAPDVQTPPLNPYQTLKGLVVVTAVVALFLGAPWPREVVALTAAGLLLTSRRLASRDMLGLVDWHLLVLFAGLFVVNHALAASGTLGRLLDLPRQAGVHVEQPAALFLVTALLSNIVSNVPATMLLLPSVIGPDGAVLYPTAGAILALASTLAGNLLIVGSIANIIVVEGARPLGVRIGWRQHARVGVPVTAATLLIAAAWLWLRN